MTTPQIRRLWLRLGQVAGLTVMAMLGIIDVRYGMLQLSLDGLVLSLVRVGLAVATVRVWLPEHPQNSRRLPSLALLLAAASIAVTVATLTAGFGLTGVWGLAETCGLLASIYVVARRGRPGRRSPRFWPSGWPASCCRCAVPPTTRTS
ncbi:hypothetical protein GCM10027612_18040 [Microbispora bryophytorum subsp. camponoti]